MPVEGKPATEFTLVDKSIKVAADRSVAFLTRPLTPEEAVTSCLRWRWEVQETMRPTDLSKPGADDRPLAVHLVFPFSGKGVGLWQRLMRHLVASELGKPFAGRMLTYVWGGDRPSGSWLKNPFLPKDAALVILQPGTAPTSMWKREIVSFRQDYERIFGGKAPDPAYVAISGDSDDTHTRSVGYLSDLGFGRDPAACRDEP